MIVTLMNGEILRTVVGNCTGYVAKRIELEAKDCDSLAAMLKHDPEHLRSVLAQLGHRFPERRAPYQHQQDTIDMLTRDENGLTVGQWKLNDGPGIGKTRTMEEIAAQYEAAGYKIHMGTPRRFGKRPELAMGYQGEPPKTLARCSLLRWFLFWFTLVFLYL